MFLLFQNTFLGTGDKIVLIGIAKSLCMHYQSVWTNWAKEAYLVPLFMIE